MKILCLGDIVGRPGRQVLHQKLPGLVRERKIDLVIANAENIAGGSGITNNLFQKIRSYGVDVVTLGDHVFRKADIIPAIRRRVGNGNASQAGRRLFSFFTRSNTSSSVC